MSFSEYAKSHSVRSSEATANKTEIHKVSTCLVTINRHKKIKVGIGIGIELFTLNQY